MPIKKNTRRRKYNSHKDLWYGWFFVTATILFIIAIIFAIIAGVILSTYIAKIPS